jgi:hypothetical protein
MYAFLFQLHCDLSNQDHEPGAIQFQIPINSNIIGAAPATRTTSYGRDVSFAVAYVELCDMMGLDPATASIGFKWDNEKANAPTHVLANAADWVNCIENGLGQQKRARTRTVVCMIRNRVRF